MSRALLKFACHALVALVIAACGTQSFGDDPLAADAGQSDYFADAQDPVASTGCGDGLLASDEECDDGNDDD